MTARTLLVTYEVDDERRRTVEEALPPSIEAVFLADIDPDRHPSAVAAADAILTFVPERELSEDAFEALHAGQVIQTLTAGIDHLPLDRVPEGATLCSNAGGFAKPMAEHVVALYFALAKRLLIEHRNLTEGEWNQFEPTMEIAGSTCAIVGFGGVGQASARRLQRLDVEVLAINRSGEAELDPAFLGTPADLEYVLRECDGLVLTAPLTPETRGMIDAEALSWMADDAMLINVARGELIDQEALYEHLKANPEFQAGLEAWWVEPMRDGKFELDYPLLELPNVLGCPHNSAQVPGSRERAQRQAVENVVAALTEGTVQNVVDPSRGY